MSDVGQKLWDRLIQPWFGKGKRWVLARIAPMTIAVYYFVKDWFDYHRIAEVLSSAVFWCIEAGGTAVLVLIYLRWTRPPPPGTYVVALARFKCVVESPRSLDTLRAKIREDIIRVAKNYKLSIRCVLLDRELDPTDDNFEREAAKEANLQPCHILISAYVRAEPDEFYIVPAVTAGIQHRRDYLGAPHTDATSITLPRLRAKEKRLRLQQIAMLSVYFCGATALYFERYEEAIQLLTEASSLFPEADFLLGVVHLERNEPTRAIEWLKKAISRRPDFSEALYFLRVAAADVQDKATIEDADRLLKAAPPIAKETFQFYATIFHLKRLVGMFDKVTERFGKIEGARRTLVNGLQSIEEGEIASQALLNEDFHSAKRHAVAALDLNPENLGAVITLAKALCQLNEHAHSMELLNRYEERIAATHNRRGDLAEAYLMSGEDNKGLKYATKYISDELISKSDRAYWVLLRSREYPPLASDASFQQAAHSVTNSVENITSASESDASPQANK